MRACWQFGPEPTRDPGVQEANLELCAIRKRNPAAAEAGVSADAPSRDSERDRAAMESAECGRAGEVEHCVQELNKNNYLTLFSVS